VLCSSFKGNNFVSVLYFEECYALADDLRNEFFPCGSTILLDHEKPYFLEDSGALLSYSEVARLRDKWKCAFLPEV
jgi:hypothetical protein